jgi:RNA polymerase sigma-B factor
MLRSVSERNAVVLANLALAEKFLRRILRRGGWRGNHPDHDDLLQAAYLGLIHAANRFDPGRGRFASLAYLEVLGQVREEMERRALIRIPSVLARKLRRALRGGGGCNPGRRN